MKKFMLSLSVGIMTCSQAFAAGFQLNLQGIRQLAMGGSGTAITWNSDIIFYNPAGMADLNLWQASVSALAIMPDVQYTNNYSLVSSEKQVFTPFNVYVGGPIGGKKLKGKLAVGLGIYTPFGSGLKWHDDWPGRYIIREIALQTIFAQPTVSYKINDRLSAGVGYVVAYGDVKLRQAVPIQDANGNDGSGELTGTAWGRGFNAGVRYKLTNRLILGLNYRSGVNMYTQNGDAKFNVASSLADSFAATKFKTSLPLPAVGTFGVGYHPTSKLTIQADVNYTFWSRYDSLRFDFARNTEQLQDIASPRMYQNTITYRLGLNYAFSDKFAVMLGGAWDESPVQDGFVTPDLPDADRTVYTGGISYRPIEKLTINAALEYVYTQPRKGNYTYEGFSGTYQTVAITPGIGISFDF